MILRKLFPVAAFAFLAIPSVQACTTDFSQLDSLVSDYGWAVESSDSSQADKIYGQIDTFLFKTIGENNECLQPALNRYLTDVFNLYNPLQHTTRPTNQGVNVANDVYYLRSWVSEMVGANRIVFLTDAKRAQLGSEWTERSAKKEYSTIGAYDCSTTTIYIDAHLRPFDLLTTLFHEMDHLVRDKLTDPEQLDPKLHDWDMYDLFDEAASLATSTQIFMQSRNPEVQHGDIVLQIDHSRGKMFVISAPENEAELAQKHKSNFRKYQSKNDFTMFSDKGTLSQFITEIGEESPEDIAANYLISGSTGLTSQLRLSGTLYFSSGTVANLPPETDRARELRNSFFSIIASTYFPGKQLGLNGAADFDSFFQIPIGSTFAASQLNIDDEGRSSRKMIGLDFGESKMCKAYSLAQSSSDSYLGVRFSKQGPIRPCADFRKKL